MRRGTLVSQAISMIDSARMDQLVAELSQRADWVLFDSPGALQVADAQRIASHVDGTILIVDGVKSTLSAARRATERLNDAGANLVGFFHNRHRGLPLRSMPLI